MIKNKNRILGALVLLIIAFASLSACSGQQSVNGTDGSFSDVIEDTDVSTADDISDDDAKAYAETVKEKSGYAFSSFQTTDLSGNDVTETIFADKDYTMINMWATYCPSCIQEMPELAELSDELPDNFQMIGLITDLAYGQENERIKDEADNIIESTGIDYTNIKLSTEMIDTISALTNFVPTTFFVDSEGNILGDPIIGADINAYKDRIVALAK